MTHSPWHLHRCQGRGICEKQRSRGGYAAGEYCWHGYAAAKSVDEETLEQSLEGCDRKTVLHQRVGAGSYVRQRGSYWADDCEGPGRWYGRSLAFAPLMLPASRSAAKR